MITECPHCDWRGPVEEEYKGIESECPSCEKDFMIKDCGSSIAKEKEDNYLPVAGRDSRDPSTNGITPVNYKVIDAKAPKEKTSPKKKSILARFFVITLLLSVVQVSTRLF
jgi:hypothetical protein